MSQKSNADSKFFYGSPDKMSNIKTFPLIPLLSCIIPKTLPLMRGHGSYHGIQDEIVNRLFQRVRDDRNPKYSHDIFHNHNDFDVMNSKWSVYPFSSIFSDF